jgi:fatty acid desaturase
VATFRERKPDMTLDRSVLMFAGIMVLASVVLTLWVSPLFVWLTLFIGANLIQASVTGFCPAASFFRKLGVKSGCAF